MTRTNARHLRTFTLALEANRNLCANAFVKLDSAATTEAIVAHSEIEQMCVEQKSDVFYRHFFPLRADMIALLADSYRQYFKLALAHESTTGGDPDEWARTQLQPTVRFALEWMRDWYIFACDGESRRVRHVAPVEFVPGQTVSAPFPAATPWRAPAWLFQLSLVHFGIEVLKTQHAPTTDSGEKLGQAHTRLLLKGVRRVFLWQLGAACRTVRNEETAAAGAIPQTKGGGQTEEPNKRKDSKRPLKGVDGLVRKVDLSQYMHNLTEKQQLAFSLKFEYELGLAEIASRMGLDRKTAYEHIEAAKRKIDQARSNEKSKAHRPKSEGE